MDNTGSSSCCLCGIQQDDQLKFGQLFNVGDVSAHHFCLLFSPHLAQNGKDDEGAEGFLPADIKAEVARVTSTICYFCNKGGASGLCMSMKCKKHYHVGCAVQANGLLQFFGQFKSFCEEHRPRQNVVGREAGENCGICLERTNPDDAYNVLWTPCCRHFFHRPCLQRMAYHFGYFFYCPGCRNKDNISGFLKHMRHFGIFIPKRDASWEMVPNAFGELLERHLMCDVRYCLCSRGRAHQDSEDDSSPWRLCVCDTCGSAGTHLACSDLAASVVSWACSACSLQRPLPAQKCSLKEFVEGRAAASMAQGGAGGSGVPRLQMPLTLHEILAELEEPEKLVKFTVSPISGLTVQTRPVSGVRLAAREPGGRPVTFSSDQLLPEAAVSAEEQAWAEQRLWSQNHVAATEAGGHCGYSPARRQEARAARGRRLPAAATFLWTERVGASNTQPGQQAGEGAAA
ncbi:PHD finger protein 7-like [Pollicipes pollicipes]|uniref:PHD finger protein 7-like n=1 Tax=Pollicipes pollicipes TaxID=41117 RepID=UPI0018859055|nr:PHD finger protein 7-like [Pollicipes pollicipes]